MAGAVRSLAVLAMIAALGVSGALAQTPPPSPLDLRSCPEGDFVLQRSLPAGVQPQVQLDPATLAQPRGGAVRFLIRDWPGAVFQSSFTVCFRWRSAGAPNPTIMASPVPVRIVSVNGKEVVIGAIVPNLPSTHTRFGALLNTFGLAGESAADASPRTYTLSNVAPIADVLLRITDDAGNHLDTLVGVGVSSQSLAIATTALLLGLTLFFLCRLKGVGNPGLPPVNIFLRLITAGDGRAALSQFQIMLWSFVVGGGAIYVMMLTGDLIDVTTGTLVLLGISGGATLATEMSKGSTARTPVDRPPRWADMVTSPDGTEIDVTHVQMLFFTVITALFVTIKIVTGYAIPEIPDGFLVLMGLSNGVYVSKTLIPVAGAGPQPAPAEPTRSAADSPAPTS